MQLIFGVSRRYRQHDVGFTILELMIASTIFTVILVTVAVGVIRFTDTYYKGINTAKVEAANQEVVAEVAQALEFGKQNNLFLGSTIGGICADNTLYAFSVGQEVLNAPGTSHQGYHGLLVSTAGNCSGGIPPNISNILSTPGTSALPANTRELLGQHMRISELDVQPSGNLYTIHSRLIYGEDDLLSPSVPPTPSLGQWASYRCLGAAGDQFCAVSDLTTTVEKRLL